jgi:hypothetical protein
MKHEPRRSRATRRYIALSLLVSLALTGCYRLADQPTNLPAPATRIVAELTPEGSRSMAPIIGEDALGVEGIVVERRPAEWELEVLRVDHRGGQSIQWNGERISFPAEHILEARERRFDRTMTAVFIGGVAVVATALAVSFIRFVGTGDEGSGGGTSPPQ